jgi:hypothetical protein
MLLSVVCNLEATLFLSSVVCTQPNFVSLIRCLYP